MNTTHITGRLATDVQVKDVAGKSLATFTLASNNGDRTLFIPVEVWNHPHLAESLAKGSRALVSGSLKQENWEAKDGGGRRSRLVLVGHYVEFLDPRPASSSATTAEGGTRAATAGPVRWRGGEGEEGDDVPMGDRASPAPAAAAGRRSSAASVPGSAATPRRLREAA